MDSKDTSSLDLRLETEQIALRLLELAADILRDPADARHQVSEVEDIASRIRGLEALIPEP